MLSSPARTRLAACLVAMVVVLAGCAPAVPQPSGGPLTAVPVMNTYLMTVGQSGTIRHALGGVDGHMYLDSIDGLKQDYGREYRLFEADVNFTSDGVLVLAHGWTESDHVKRLGMPYDPADPVPTYETFMGSKIQGRYTATSFRDLAGFMRTHTDMFVLLDFADRSYQDTVTAYSEVVREAGRDDSVLQRFIVGGHTTDMIDAVKTTWHFTLYNLYLDVPQNRTGILKNLDDYIGYCRNNDISSFSTAVDTFTPQVAAKMRTSGLVSYVFTTNDKKEADSLRDLGATIIGTDFLP